MDRNILLLDAVLKDDLMYCENEGVAYQASMKHIIDYSEDYFNKYLSYEDTEIAKKLNEGRIAFVEKHFGAGFMLDVGIGSGEFIKKRGNCFGFDVNKFANDWLLEQGFYSEIGKNGIKAYSFWDVIEHVKEPSCYFTKMVHGDFVFVSIPIFGSLTDIKKSKHYRPDEHLYYFTRDGFVNWMKKYYFELIDESDFETKAGRDGIMSFCFKKDWYGSRSF